MSSMKPLGSIGFAFLITRTAIAPCPEMVPPLQATPVRDPSLPSPTLLNTFNECGDLLFLAEVRRLHFSMLSDLKAVITSWHVISFKRLQCQYECCPLSSCIIIRTLTTTHLPNELWLPVCKANLSLFDAPLYVDCPNCRHLFQSYHAFPYLVVVNICIKTSSYWQPHSTVRVNFCISNKL